MPAPSWKSSRRTGKRFVCPGASVCRSLIARSWRKQLPISRTLRVGRSEKQGSRQVELSFSSNPTDSGRIRHSMRIRPEGTIVRPADPPRRSIVQPGAVLIRSGAMESATSVPASSCSISQEQKTQWVIFLHPEHQTPQRSPWLFPGSPTGLTRALVPARSLSAGLSASAPGTCVRRPALRTIRPDGRIYRYAGRRDVKE